MAQQVRAEGEKAWTADTRSGAFDASSVGHNGAQQHTPRACSVTSHDSGKRLIFLSQETCGLERFFLSYFFFPLFVVKYWSRLEGKHSGVWSFTVISSQE